MQPLVDLLARAGVSPSAVTLAGLGITAVAAWQAWAGGYAASAAILAAGSLLDAVDGGLARKTGRVTRGGAVLDSSCDRVGEFLMFTALMTGRAAAGSEAVRYLAPAALGGSFMVSYARARAEGVGVACSSGFFTRTERLVLMVLSLAATVPVGDARPISWMLAVVAAGSWATAAGRLAGVFRADRKA